MSSAHGSNARSLARQVSHAAHVQRDAQSAVAECGSSSVSQVTKTLASLGTRGEHQANVERDLMRWAQRQMPAGITLYG